MKITHRNPAANWFAIPQSAVIDPDYEAEVQWATERGEREYRRRAERLQRAKDRLTKATRARTSAKRLAVLEAAVELRRQELEAYRRLMVASAASAEHRGVKSYRPVPNPGGMP
jgi:uncharacterized protein (DUF2132 family)